MKAILMSGSYRKIEIPQNIIYFINDNLLGKKNISFIAANFDEREINDKFVNKLINAFEGRNLKFENYYVIDSRYSKEEMINNIKKSNIIFLLGGDTLKQIKAINDYDLKNVIYDNSKVIIGISAGAINMAKKVVLAKDIEDNIPNLSIYEGLGLTNINIEPHCDFRNKRHWEDLEEASIHTDLVVMNEDAYIIINDENIKYYGNFLILKNGKIFYKDKECMLEEFLKAINYD